jgi:hypothetical protein
MHLAMLETTEERPKGNPLLSHNLNLITHPVLTRCLERSPSALEKTIPAIVI